MQSEHFTDAELACRHCGINATKPALVLALEDLRRVVGRPILIDDAYRCVEHNRAVGGVPLSEHVRGEAADIRIDGMTPAQMYAAALRVPAFRDGGIGVALHQGYIHVDVRARLARWCYDAAGKQCPWDTSTLGPRSQAVNA